MNLSTVDCISNYGLYRTNVLDLSYLSMDESQVISPIESQDQGQGQGLPSGLEFVALTVTDSDLGQGESQGESQGPNESQGQAKIEGEVQNEGQEHSEDQSQVISPIESQYQGQGESVTESKSEIVSVSLTNPADRELKLESTLDLGLGLVYDLKINTVSVPSVRLHIVSSPSAVVTVKAEVI